MSPVQLLLWVVAVASALVVLVATVALAWWAVDRYRYEWKTVAYEDGVAMRWKVRRCRC